MTARNLLSELRKKGVEVRTSGDDRLVIDAPKGAITPELRSALAAHKAELLQILKNEQQPPAPAELKTPDVVAAPIASAKPVDEDDSPASLASEEIKQLEAELIRLKAEEQTRRAEFEAERLGAENALRFEHERRSQAEAESSRQRAEHEKQRIAAEAREHAEEESRRRIAEQELARAEEELKRMRAMEDARRADVEARLRAAEEAHRAELEKRRHAEEEQARVYAEEQRRLLEGEARKRAQEDELRRHAEMRFHAVEVEIARVQAREDARRRSAEDARMLTEHAALRRAEDEARLRAQIEAQMRAEAEGRRKVEDEARRQAEEEARRRAEEEASRMAALEAQRRAEEAARQHAEAESRRQAEEAARRRAEEEALRHAQTEAKLRAEEEARLKAADEVRQRAEMEARIRVEVEAKIRAEDEARHQVEVGSHRPENVDSQMETYPFEIERSEVREPPARDVSGKVNEIVEWFDVSIESQPAVSADQHPSHESLAGLMQDDSGGEFHAVSVPEAERAPSAVPAATLSQLGSDKAAERAAAVLELARFGGQDALRHINTAFNVQSVEVRSNVARALFNSPDDRMAAFTRALREATPARRRKIGAAIASSGLAQEAIRNLTGESRDKTYDAFSLLFLMSKAGEVQPLMRAIEDHPNMEVRLAVVKLVALSGQPDILPAFRRMAVRGSLPPEVRSAVMEAIYQITSQTPADAPSMS